jgi:hypothetical protein
MLIVKTRRYAWMGTASALGCCSTRPSSLRPRSALGGAACVAVCLLCTLACGGGSPAAPEAERGDIGDSAPATATFSEVYTTILGPVCSGCHTPGGDGSFQDFSSQSSAYAALVGVTASGPACGSSGEQRVVAGNATQSLLFQKVSEANPPCGSRMPLGGQPLSGTQLTLIENWINQGAQND